MTNYYIKKIIIFFIAFSPLPFLSPRPPLPRLLFTIGSSLSGHFNQRRGHPDLALPPTCSSQPRIGVPRRRDRAKPPSNPTANLSFHRRSDRFTADPAFLELNLPSGALSYPSRGWLVPSPIVSQLVSKQVVADFVCRRRATVGQLTTWGDFYELGMS